MAGASHKARAAPRRKPVPIRRVRPKGNILGRIARILRDPQGPQAKLKIGAVNDPAEREADVVAARALSGAPDAPMSALTQPAPIASPLRRNAMDQPNLDTLDVTPAMPEVTQDVELPASEDVNIATLDASELKELETGAPDQKTASGHAAEEASQEVQKKNAADAMGPLGGDAPRHIETRIATPGAGRALPTGLRRDMEARFGTSFGDVRLHDTPGARDTAAAIGARAFTHGSAIWMGHGESPENKALMAHELTHVVQQTGRQSRLMPATQKATAAPAPQRRIDRFFGDAVLEKIDGFARNLPGYLLLSVLLGQSPVTRKPVERTAGKVIGGLLGLIPGGSILVEQLGLAKSMDDAFDWIVSQLGVFNLTWTRVKAAVARARDAFTLRSPIESLRPVFKPLYDSILGFARAAKDKVMEFIVKGALSTAGPFGEKVWGILKTAGETLKTIVLNPVRFAKNLILAVLKGFGHFLSNILKHLKKGLLGFLFGSLQGLDIELPEKLDLKGIFSIVTQILGLTWKNIRRVLVKRLGRRGEKIVSFLEKSVDIVRLLVTKGVMGIWQKVLGLIEGLKTTVIGGLIEFVTVSLAKAAMGWLAGLSNPAGWVVKIVLIVYDFIVLFLERMQQIMELATSIFTSVAAIAAGKIDAAAKKIEESIGRTIPLVLAFLSAIIPVTGIASKIRKIFNRLRKPVEKAISRVVKFIIKKAKKLLAKIIGKLNRARKLPSKTFRIGKKSHKLFAKRKGKAVEIYAQSTLGTSDEKSLQLNKEKKVFSEHLSGQELKDVLAFIIAFERKTDDAEEDADKIKSNSKKKPQTKELAELEKEITEAGIVLTKYGIVLGENPRIETEDPKALLRFREEITGFEGQTGLYNMLDAIKDKEVQDGGGKAARDYRVIELDHNPNLAALKVVQDWLKEKSAGKTDHTRVHFKSKGDTAAQDKAPSFGNLSLYSANSRGEHFPAMAVYGPVNNAMSGKDKDRADEMRDLTKQKDLRSISTVKTKLRAQMAEKSREIEAEYSNEPDPLKTNIEKGNRNIVQVAIKELMLSEANGEEKEPLGDGVAGLARTIAMSPDENDPPNFLENEGAAGLHYAVSRDFSRYKYLEADHNPASQDMVTASNWTLGQIAGPRVSQNLLSHKKIEAVSNADTREKIRIRLSQAMEEKVNTKGFSKNAGGAMVVSARINQAETMKKPDVQGLKSTLDGGKRRFEAIARDRIVSEAIKNTAAGTSKDGKAEARIARNDMLPGVLAGIKRMVLSRQEQTFDLYARTETPKVREINAAESKGDQAVALMARIAARVRSAEAANTLQGLAVGYFPKPGP